jgi:alpha,alpha-trehalase
LDRLHCGIVTDMTEWPTAVDRRYHDAVIFDLDGLVTETVSGGVRVFDSTVPLLRRLREVGAAAAVYSCGRNCAEVLHAAGIDEFVSMTVTETDAGEKLDPAVLIETARRPTGCR